MEEISRILKVVKNRLAPGEDGVSYKALKIFNKMYTDILPELFTTCCCFGVFPDAWKPDLVVWIPKPGEDPTLENSYQPITLLSTLGKMLERCISR